MNNYLNCNTLTFKGVVPPYKRSGFNVMPIYENPSQQDIASAIEATKKSENNLGTGLNGSAFTLGQDLVVKAYKGKKDAFDYNPMREIKVLDDMYENHLVLPRSQKGSYAMKAPDGTFYLVSTKVEGKNPIPENTSYNKENLTALVDEITMLDQGSLSKKDGERQRFMSWDFGTGNIKITPHSAGLFDMEWGEFKNLDDMIKDNIIDKKAGACPHMSDTSWLFSNLRSFEFYALCEYLQEAENSDVVFNDYLEIKGKYHKKMAEFFNEYEKETKYPDIVRKIARGEEAHSKLLAKDENGKIPKDIKKAEMMKRQTVYFVHEQSDFNTTGHVYAKIVDGKVLTSQVAEYIKAGKTFGNKMLKKAKTQGDKDREIYYSNFLEFLSAQEGVKGWMQYQIDQAPSQDKSDSRVITNKLVDKPVKTLDDVLSK